MVKKYRQMLVDQKVIEEIAAAKSILGSRGGRKPSSREVIDEFLGRRLRFLRLPGEVRRYLNAFVSSAVLNEGVLGLMFFGSAARNAYGKYSDIDVLVVVKGNALKEFDDINRRVEEADGRRKELLAKGLFLRIRPLMMSADELDRFRPIYIDFFEDGVVLFERDDTLTDFLSELRRTVDYERRIVNNSVMIRWKIRG